MRVTQRKDPSLHKPDGRPTQYKADYARIAFRHALLGATDQDLAACFAVNASTITTWKHKHPKFLASILDGRVNADAHVAKSLYGRAVGYDVPEEEIRIVKGRVKRIKVIKHYPPDVVAQQFWLRNRQRALFSSNPEVQIAINNQVDVQTTKTTQEMTIPELREQLETLRRRALGESGNQGGVTTADNRSTSLISNPRAISCASSTPNNDVESNG